MARFGAAFPLLTQPFEKMKGKAESGNQVRRKANPLPLLKNNVYNVSILCQQHHTVGLTTLFFHSGVCAGEPRSLFTILHC
jgi:hypothetical protein